MMITKPDYNFETLKAIAPEYRRKAKIMREICSRKHEQIIFWDKLRNFGTTAASITVIALTFFGTQELATATGWAIEFWDWFFRLASLALVLLAVWQLVKDKSQIAFVFFSGIQDFSTIINMIDFIVNAESMTKTKASDAAGELFAMYDRASREIPRISNEEHAAVKKDLGL